MQLGPAGEQVTDFAYDEDSGLLGVDRSQRQLISLASSTWRRRFGE